MTMRVTDPRCKLPTTANTFKGASAIGAKSSKDSGNVEWRRVSPDGVAQLTSDFGIRFVPLRLACKRSRFLTAKYANKRKLREKSSVFRVFHIFRDSPLC